MDEKEKIIAFMNDTFIPKDGERRAWYGVWSEITAVCRLEGLQRNFNKKKYGYRVLLIYADGSEVSQQKSGFETKKAANTDRDKTIGELYSGTYVVYANVKVKDFMLFWLEKEMRPRITSDSYVSYANIVKNHIIPAIGTMKMTELNRSHVQTLYNEEAAVSVWSARQVKTVMNTSMRYAVSKKIISVNPTSGVELPKRVEKQKYHTRSIDEKKALNIQQILTLIEASKETPIHMQVLFAVLLGLRRCEINGVKYSDIDYINRRLSGRPSEVVPQEKENSADFSCDGYLDEMEGFFTG